jgi:hypothetical protein
MTRPTRRTMALAATLIAALAVPALATPSDLGAARRGAVWLGHAVPGGGNGQSADTAVSLRAAGVLSAREKPVRAAALRSGARSYATTPGAAGKVALGLVALGARAPRCAGGVDLLARMQAGLHGGRYGRTMFDQSLAMLATRALGHPVPRSAVRFLQRTRHGGGWGVIAGQGDDVSSTAMAILALRAARVSAGDAAIRAGLSWLGRQRTPSGGFALGRRDRNESNSTALAIEAYASVGRHDTRALRALRGLQRGDGSFNFTATDAGSRVIASTDAVVALAGRHVPVVALARPARGC